MKTVAMIFFALLSITAGTVRAEDPVVFANAALKAEVEHDLGVSNPTPTDMLGLTELYINYKGISDLTGLEYALNLEVLYCYGNGITDLSPLSGLPHLTELVFSFGNNVTDLSPLANLTSLRYLNFEANQASDLSPLAGLTSLRRLYADHNGIIDMSPLAALKNLVELEMDQNKIVDISVLSELNNLDWIDLDHNRIQDISVLTKYKSVRKIDVSSNPLNMDACEIYLPKIIANNPGAEIVYDACTDNPPAPFQYTITLSSTDGGSVTVPGEGVNGPYTEGSQVAVQATPEPGYIFSFWTGTAVAAGQVNPVDQAAATVTLYGNYTLQANFVEWAPLTLYVDDNGVGDPAPGDTQISDPLENGTVTHPFDRIQEAIDMAVDGTIINIAPGTYYENIDFQGKTLKLIGLDPNDPNAYELPVVLGEQMGPVVRFSGGEGPGSLLMGLAIAAGQGQAAGGIECLNGDPTFSHCLITGNRATAANGAGIYCADSNVVIIHCTIADNAGGSQGAGLILQDSHAIVVNSIIWGNQPWQVQIFGQSFFFAQYTDIADPLMGPGNLNVNPDFVQPGYWADMNNANLVLEPHDPQAVWMPGDYHLQAQGGRWHDVTQTWVMDDVTSPCIDAGDPIISVGNESDPHGDRINIGVYGGSSAASRSFVPDDGTVHFNDDLLKSKVMEQLQLWSDPEPADMLILTVFKFFGQPSLGKQISDLTGLEYAVNLQDLYLRYNLLTDVSPLLGLKHLLFLNLSENNISDVSAFASMTQLKSLDIHGNGISDISALANLTGLTELTLRDNQLAGGLSPLTNLTNLEMLDLQENGIYDISSLRRMTKLKDLNLHFNWINSISTLKNLSLLETLDLSHNQISGISSLTGLTHLKKLSLEDNFLNQDAYNSDLQTIINNNPGIEISYDPNPY